MLRQRAMAQHGSQAPFKVLDSGFRGRAAEGAWLGGPVDGTELSADSITVDGNTELRAHADGDGANVCSCVEIKQCRVLQKVISRRRRGRAGSVER